MKATICAAMPALLLNAALLGQALTGTVVRTVTDQSGAAVPQTAVSIRKIGTGLVSNTVTNAEGQCRADAFPTGTAAITG